MHQSCHKELILKHGWARTSLLELQDFSDTSAALWPIVNEFSKNLPRSNLSDSCSAGWGLWFCSRKKKPGSILCPDDKDIKVLLSPQNQHRQTTVSGSARYLNGLVTHRNWYRLIYTVHATSLCTSCAARNSSRNTGGPRHLHQIPNKKRMKMSPIQTKHPWIKMQQVWDPIVYSCVASLWLPFRGCFRLQMIRCRNWFIYFWIIIFRIT